MMGTTCGNEKILPHGASAQVLDLGDVVELPEWTRVTVRVANEVVSRAVVVWLGRCPEESSVCVNKQCRHGERT